MNRRPPWQAFLWGASLSTAIELSQMFMVGRTSALNDILFNSVGAWVGGAIISTAPSWWRPANNTNRALFFCSLLCAVLLGAATVILLSPLDSPAIPRHSELRLRRSSPGGPGEIVAVIDVDIPSSDERFYFGRESDDFLIRYPALAIVRGLDQPEYWVARRPRDGSLSDSVRVSLDRERARWVFRVGEEPAVTSGPTIGQGWTLLAYPEAIGRKWGALLNAIWVAVLFAPAAFWARRRLTIVLAVTVVLALVAIPLVTGTAPTSKCEWAGAVAGFLSGLLLRHVVGTTPRDAIPRLTSFPP